jgi:hypothetical protein
MVSVFDNEYLLFELFSKGQRRWLLNLSHVSRLFRQVAYRVFRLQTPLIRAQLRNSWFRTSYFFSEAKKALIERHWNGPDIRLNSASIYDLFKPNEEIKFIESFWHGIHIHSMLHTSSSMFLKEVCDFMWFFPIALDYVQVFLKKILTGSICSDCPAALYVQSRINLPQMPCTSCEYAPHRCKAYRKGHPGF